MSAQTSTATRPVARDTTQPPELSLGGEPVVFAPDTLSTSAAEFSGALAPDGQTVYFTVTDRAFSRMTIVVSHRQSGVWQRPRVAAFSGVWNDGDPSLSPDGTRLFFISNRPRVGTAARADFDIWYVTLRPDGSWGEPKNAGQPVSTDTAEVSPSMTRDGTLYFSRRGRMYRTRLQPDGSFAALETLPFKGGNIAVSPDERVVVFVGYGKHPGDTDLFASCRSESGPAAWSPARRLAAPVSPPFVEGDPSFSPDGRTLYFASERTPPAGMSWPRKRKATYSDVLQELQSNTYNGLRNLYSIDASTLCR